MPKFDPCSETAQSLWCLSLAVYFSFRVRRQFAWIKGFFGNQRGAFVRKTAAGHRQARSFGRVVGGPRLPRKAAILATAAGTALLSLTAFTSVASAATVRPAPLAW